MTGNASPPPSPAAGQQRLPGRVATTVFVLAATFLGGLWMTAVHLATGTEDGVGLPPWELWLRDSGLALPLVGGLVWVALQAGARSAASSRSADGGRAAPRRWTVGVLTGVAAAVGFAVAAPLPGLLWGAPAGRPQGVPVRIGREFLIGLPGLVPVMTAVACVTALAWATGSRRRRAPGRRARLALTAVASLVLALAGTGGEAFAKGGDDPTPVPPPPTTGSVAATPASPGNPCPAGTPTKSFEITALDVVIPVNRFGDHDPAGKMYTLTKNIAAVRAEEASKEVSVGLGDDPIQPLVIRANEGDCVKIHFTNTAGGGDYGIHIDGLAFGAGSSGDAIGFNAKSSVPKGGAADYVYYVPNDVTLEGAHYLHPGPGERFAVGHGLFGALVVEPPGSTYLDNQDVTRPFESGWQGIIVPAGAPSFRENVQVYSELGDENTQLFDKNNNALPQVDPRTDAYRPGSKWINYRTEPFMDRLGGPNNSKIQEALGYSSYTFGDPATPMPRSYLADPEKIRIIHAGSEMFHVFHLHGGGIRWRFNPHADLTYDYARTGLFKLPAPDQVATPSTRLDSQAFGPGESYDMEIEGGAGGVQQVAGEFLFHCHIANHYVSGMWSFWRVYNTLQPDLARIPERTALPVAVDSTRLIGKTFNGVRITAQNLKDWIAPQLPPPGVRTGQNDAAVWDWRVGGTTAAPVYLGEPETTTRWVDDNNFADQPGHPTGYHGDVFVGNRPKILFDPDNGRIAWPLTRPHIGMRPPFSGNGHTGAPYLGETVNAPPNPQRPASTIDPYARRPDGLCPTAATVRHYNITAIELPIQVTKTQTDPDGKIYVLSKDAADIRAGRKPAEPLAIRANVGDCVAVTLTSDQTDAKTTGGFAKVNIHIHHVQFDTEASDGVITGMEYEQSVRPYRTEAVQLARPVGANATVLPLTAAPPTLRPGVWVAVGEGTDGIEVRQIASVNRTAKTVTLVKPLGAAHAAGEFTGVEFVQYRWYADTALDNIFFHDHVDALHTWGHGLVGSLVVEPAGSTYHDPVTGREIDSGAQADIHTDNPLVAGTVDGSFREQALWTIDNNPLTDSTINLKAEPYADRAGDPADRFSSGGGHGDPITPLPRAYVGDPVVFRAINVSEGVDGLNIDGHRFSDEARYPRTPDGQPEATPTDTLHIGVSERFTAALQGGAGGEAKAAGDYVYANTIDRRARQGAWGLLRVLDRPDATLQPLPGRTPTPASTGVCPGGAPTHIFQVAAVDVPSQANLNDNKVRAAFVPLDRAAAVERKQLVPEPLVLHVAKGECITVSLTNRRAGARASFHDSELLHLVDSAGGHVGNNPDSTVAPGGQRDYTFFADTDMAGATLVTDLGGDDTGKIGLYGAVDVAPAGATFTDPVTGAATDVGSKVDVHVPGRPGSRDFTLIFSDNDPRIGQNHMPYPNSVDGGALVNYQSVANQGRAIDSSLFSSVAHGDPSTPVLTAYAGDPTTVHLLVSQSSEQMHTLNLGGHSFQLDPGIHQAQAYETRGLAPAETLDATLMGGAGGVAGTVGDFFYGDLRRPFTEAGMWGLIRVLGPAGPNCPIKPLSGTGCGQ